MRMRTLLKFKTIVMETTIFYFSASGNSLNLARRLTEELDNCRLVSIARVVKQNSICVDTPGLGFVFPVFAWGLPGIVSELVSKLDIRGRPYIFAVATCVAIPGNTLKQLRKELKEKGGELKAGFVVSSGRSSLMKLNSLDKIIIAIDRKRKSIRNGESGIQEITSVLRRGENHPIETSSLAANIFGSVFHPLAIKSFKTKDAGFEVKGSCTGCGNCALICPRSNISIVDCRPVFHHNCELCHACIQWCPGFAIRHEGFDSSLKQYHHPSVQMKDLIVR